MAAERLEDRRYRLEFLESALREWQALDGSVKGVFKKQLEARLENPHFPGSELHGSLAGCYKIKLRAQGYRLVYQVRDEVLVVLVIAIDRRDKDKVCEAALRRMEGLLNVPGDEARTILRKALSDAAPESDNLARAVQARFKPLGGIDLRLPVREPMRPKPAK